MRAKYVPDREGRIPLPCAICGHRKAPLIVLSRSSEDGHSTFFSGVCMDCAELITIETRLADEERFSAAERSSHDSTT